MHHLASYHLNRYPSDMSAVVQGLSQLRKSALDFIKEVPDDAISCASGGRKTLYKSVDYRLDLNTVRCAGS